MKLSALKVDSARLEAGDWVGDIPGMEDLRLKVRAIGNLDYRRLQARLYAAIPKGERVDGVVDPAAQDRIQGQLLAETVLIGWDGFVEDDGSPIAFSPVNATALLGSPDFAPFRDAVLYAAGKLAEARAVAVKDDVGNSAPPSAGG